MKGCIGWSPPSGMPDKTTSGLPVGGAPPREGLPPDGPAPGGSQLDGPPSGADGSPGPVRRVADVLAGELGWSAQRTTEEIERFAQEARAEGLAG